jgi:hypothetical protein
MFGKASQRETFRTLGLEGHNGFAFENPATAWDRSAAAGTAEASQAAQAAQGDEDLARILGESADPATPPARLYEIAAQHAQARPVIAGNPAAYPALLEWLAEQQDPEIDRALALRRG